MEIVEFINDRLSIFKNLYDSIRIVDPINKKTISVKEEQVAKVEETCHLLWKENNFCNNCVSMRAYIQNDTFVKIEYNEDKIFLITATPVVFKDNIYVVELLKNISQNGSILDKNKNRIYHVDKLICEINEKAIRDELTGVYNRRYINERLPVDINNSIVNKYSLSVIMTDIDFFKNINDKNGHVIGDKVLKGVAELISESIRKDTDWVGRYGGEEFLIVLNNTESKNAFKVAEKIRNTLENTTFRYDDLTIKITSSFGVYELKNKKSTVDELIFNVDKNLYEAKNSGRNKTIV